MKHFIEVDAFIWDRDSYGLFDFESKVLVQSARLKTLGSLTLVRDDLTIKTGVPQLDDNQETFQKLVSIVYKHGSYWVYH